MATVNDSCLLQQPSQKDAADQNFDYMFKLLIIGNSSVGKTSFLFRYADDSFTSAFVSTVGIDFKVKTVFRNNKRIKLQIWVCVRKYVLIVSSVSSMSVVPFGASGDLKLRQCFGLLAIESTRILQTLLAFSGFCKKLQCNRFLLHPWTQVTFSPRLNCCRRNIFRPS